MHAPRIIAISPDEVFGRCIATALESIDAAVEVYGAHASVPSGEPVGLWVLHLESELAGITPELSARLAGASTIAILPRSNLAAVAELMQSHEQIVGAMVAEDFEPRQLTAMATRILGGDGFGVAKLLAPGASIQTHVIGDHDDKLRCIAQISAFVEQLGISRLHLASIEQCIDEMVMNALYDAPVDGRCRHVFAGVPTMKRVTMRTDHEVVVEYASDGERFAIAVRDSFGRLERPTVLRHLLKGLYAAQKVDRKAGGAGLGLYLMVSSSSAVYFNVLPGIACEAVCMFDLEAPKRELEQFGFFVQRDPAGRVASGPARVILTAPAARRRMVRRIAAIMTACVVLALGVFVLPPLLAGPPSSEVTLTTAPAGAEIEIEGRRVGTTAHGSLVLRDLEVGRVYPVTARLDGYEPQHIAVTPPEGRSTVTFELRALAIVQLDSQPPDATVEIDGAPMGATPLTLGSLAPGSNVTIVFAKIGYRSAAVSLQVPARGEVKSHVQPLALSDELVRVRFVSNPPGAEVIRDGNSASTDRTYTPAEVFVEAGKEQHFMLAMPNHVPLVIEPFVPERGAQGLEKGGDLVAGVTLRIESARPGKITVSNAPHCKDVAVPFDCTLAPGSYVVELVAPGDAKVTRTVLVAGGDQVEKFD